MKANRPFSWFGTTLGFPPGGENEGSDDQYKEKKFQKGVPLIRTSSGPDDRVGSPPIRDGLICGLEQCGGDSARSSPS
jgi:hypothetical protein